MNRQNEVWNYSETGGRPDESFQEMGVNQQGEVNQREEVNQLVEVNQQEEVNRNETDDRTYDDYLTEEELYQLITETEESDLIKAPSDFMEQVLSRMESAHGWEEDEMPKQEADGAVTAIDRPPRIVSEENGIDKPSKEGCEGNDINKQLKSANEGNGVHKPPRRDSEGNGIDKPPRENCVGNDNNKLPGAEQKRKKQREYRRYCLRVVTSCAAAILLLLLLPNLEPVDREAEFFQQDTLFDSERENRVTDFNWMSFRFLSYGLEENAGFRDAEGITKEDNAETTLQNSEADKSPETAEKESGAEAFEEAEDESASDDITENKQKHQSEERKGILESIRHSRRIFDFLSRGEKD